GMIHARATLHAIKWTTTVRSRIRLSGRFTSSSPSSERATPLQVWSRRRRGNPPDRHDPVRNGVALSEDGEEDVKRPLRRIRLGTVVVHLIAWSVALAWIIPFLGVFNTAVRPVSETTFGWWRVDSFHPTLNNFVTAFTQPIYSLSSGYRNSLIVAIPATLAPLFVAALAGYGFSRFRFPMRDYLFLTIVLLMSVPAQMVAIPIFRIMDTLQLYDNLLSLILLHTAWGLPWIILFMRNFFQALPLEVEEAARVDGASDFRIFFRIVLPMAIPAFAS